MSVLEIIALIAAVFGIVGSIVPGLPGPPVSWIGLLLLYIDGKGGDDPMSLAFLIIWLIVTIVVTIIDYVFPVWMTKVTGGHKAASYGAIIGLIAGIFLTPIGMIFGSLLGAFIGELMVTDKGIWAAFKAGLGAFLGFILGTGIKLVTSGVMLYYVIKFIA